MDRITHLHQKQQLRKDIHQYLCQNTHIKGISGPETHILGYIHDKHLNVGISVAREHTFTSKTANIGHIHVYLGTGTNIYPNL